MVYKGTVVHGQNDENVLEYHLWTNNGLICCKQVSSVKKNGLWHLNC